MTTAHQANATGTPEMTDEYRELLCVTERTTLALSTEEKPVNENKPSRLHSSNLVTIREGEKLEMTFDQNTALHRTKSLDRDQEPTVGDQEPSVGDRDTVGDQGATLGDQEPTVGDQEPTVGDQEATVGDQEAAVGDQATVGDQGATLGDQEPTVGDQEPTVRDHEATVGDQEVTVGDHEATVGDQEAAVGDQEATVGDQEATVGDQEATVGDQEVTVGDQDPTIGDQEATVEHSEATVIDQEVIGGHQKNQTKDVSVADEAVMLSNRDTVFMCEAQESSVADSIDILHEEGDMTATGIITTTSQGTRLDDAVTSQEGVTSMIETVTSQRDDAAKIATSSQNIALDGTVTSENDVIISSNILPEDRVTPQESDVAVIASASRTIPTHDSVTSSERSSMAYSPMGQDTRPDDMTLHEVDTRPNVIMTPQDAPMYNTTSSLKDDTEVSTYDAGGVIGQQTVETERNDLCIDEQGARLCSRERTSIGDIRDASLPESPPEQSSPSPKEEELVSGDKETCFLNRSSASEEEETDREEEYQDPQGEVQNEGSVVESQSEEQDEFIEEDDGRVGEGNGVAGEAKISGSDIEYSDNEMSNAEENVAGRIAGREEENNSRAGNELLESDRASDCDVESVQEVDLSRAESDKTLEKHAPPSETRVERAGQREAEVWEGKDSGTSTFESGTSDHVITGSALPRPQVVVKGCSRSTVTMEWTLETDSSVVYVVSVIGNSFDENCNSDYW